MKISLRRSEDRGSADYGWLQARYSFSFGNYYDPRHLGFGPLCVINEDRIAGGKGFPRHGHNDMEIITCVLDGALEHRDSMGHTAIIRPGEIQRMSAGTGVEHSEYNHLKNASTHLLQIWLHPHRHGLPSGYEQKDFTAALSENRPVLVASPTGREGSLTLQQDADLLLLRSPTEGEYLHKTRPQRKLWIQAAQGQIIVHDQTLKAGDGAAVENATEIPLRWQKDPLYTHVLFLLFDMGTGTTV